jgi:hypothetical protein
MRRYPMVFIFLLSFVMPLQAAADILLSGLVCPMLLAAAHAHSTATTTSLSTATKSTAPKNTPSTQAPMHNMKHCQQAVQAASQLASSAQLDTDQAPTSASAHGNCQDCPQMKCCHLCKTSTQAFVILAPNFFSPRILAQAPEQPLAFVASFNPNAVWRPPILA